MALPICRRKFPGFKDIVALVSGIGNIKNPQQSLAALRLLYTHHPCGVMCVSMAPLETFACGLLMNQPREVSAKRLASTCI